MVKLSRRIAGARRRKGVGYMIEAIVASITLFVFAVSQSPSEPVQDWSQFQREVTANDLGHTLKKTGDITPLLKRQETGSLQTGVASMTRQRLEISGSVDNLPLGDASIGFNAIPSERHTDPIRDVASTDTCSGDLEEINQESGTDIKRTEDPSQHDGVVLYFADTDPDVSGGFNGQEDYDTLYVDNKTRCQFSSSEGPIYIDEFFKWNTTSGYEYYDFKNVSGDTNEFTYFNATLAVKMKRQMNKPLNGIETGQEFDVFNLEEADMETYDMVVFKRDDAINQLDANPDQVQKLEDFMYDKPVLFLANLTESDLDSGFLSRTGLRWTDLAYESTPSGPEFGDSSLSGEVETYFRGLDGDSSALNLPPGGKVASSNGNSFIGDNRLVYAGQGPYDTDPWNATDYSMNQVDPDSVDGKPGSSCYSQDPGPALTEGSFEFPERDGDGSTTYDVINAEIGTSGNCDGTRVLSIDLDGDGVYTEEREGPFLEDENLMVEGRNYTVRIIDSDSAEFTFSGDSNVELVNYRTSYEDIEGGSRMARLGYLKNYSSQQLKMIAATSYWLLGDTRQFGEQKPSSTSTTVVGSVDEKIYMPYRLTLRWRQQ